MKHNITQSSAPIEMTMAERQKTHRDFKGVYSRQRCVLRMTAKGSSLLPMRIVKEGK